MNKLLNKSELAVEIGRSRGFVSAMIRAGYVPKYGTRSTLPHALEWLEQNPDFRMADVYPSTARLRTAQGRQPAGAGTADE